MGIHSSNPWSVSWLKSGVMKTRKGKLQFSWSRLATQILYLTKAASVWGITCLVCLHDACISGLHGEPRSIVYTGYVKLVWKNGQREKSSKS